MNDTVKAVMFVLLLGACFFTAIGVLLAKACEQTALYHISIERIDGGSHD